jgi:hypothetical protein
MLMSRSFKVIASLMLLLEEVGRYVCEMWKHGGYIESVQQDALTKCGLSERDNIRICKTWLRRGGIGYMLTSTSGRCSPRPSKFSLLWG